RMMIRVLQMRLRGLPVGSFSGGEGGSKVHQRHYLGGPGLINERTASIRTYGNRLCKRRAALVPGSGRITCDVPVHISSWIESVDPLCGCCHHLEKGPVGGDPLIILIPARQLRPAIVAVVLKGGARRVHATDGPIAGDADLFECSGDLGPGVVACI